MSLSGTYRSHPVAYGIPARRPSLSWQKLFVLTLAGVFGPPLLSALAVVVTGADPLDGFMSSHRTNTPFHDLVLIVAMLCWTAVPLGITVLSSVYALMHVQRDRRYLWAPAVPVGLALLAGAAWTFFIFALPL